MQGATGVSWVSGRTQKVRRLRRSDSNGTSFLTFSKKVVFHLCTERGRLRRNANYLNLPKQHGHWWVGDERFEHKQQQI